jgi:alkanesulfonate monooxygenase SsuD/methylene tetrahydromethanopterin reductase-like flavin-dependent oxidoreductase (luciferase family)
VGSYHQVAARLAEYREAGVDLVIGSGYPHLEEVGRVCRYVWPRLRLTAGEGVSPPRRPHALIGAATRRANA